MCIIWHYGKPKKSFGELLLGRWLDVAINIKFCFFHGRYESFVDAEVQQRAVEYFALSRKGISMVDILAEMPKFPEREVLPSLKVLCCGVVL